MAIPQDLVDGTTGRVNGSDTKVGNLYPVNCNLYNIYVKHTNDTSVDLRAEDSYGGDAVIDGVIESIVKELNPLAWFADNDTSGTIRVVMDKAIDAPLEMQQRIRNLSPIGANQIDISHTEVFPATSITFGDNS
jgi:hypothetical protein